MCHKNISEPITGIGEIIKVADSKGSRKKFKDTERIDDEELDDYNAASTSSVYPLCSGDKAHVCRFSNEQISKLHHNPTTATGAIKSWKTDGYSLCVLNLKMKVLRP